MSERVSERALRLLAMRDTLRQHSASANDLAQEFGVSRRTAERDIATLQEAPLHTPLWQDAQGKWRWLMQNLSVADMLVYGLNLPRPETPPIRAAPPGTRCAITGQPIEEGYLIRDITTEATAEFLDCFRGHPEGWISENAGRSFRHIRQTSRCWLIFDDGETHDAMISRESAEAQGRPCWSTLVREVWPSRQGQQTLCILTTNMKRRLWPKARVGQLGYRTPVYLLDADLNLDGCYLVNWPRMLDALGLIEEVYNAGYAKMQIQNGLLSSYQMSVEIGLERAVAWEKALAEIRPRIEFLMALLIAQKERTK